MFGKKLLCLVNSFPSVYASDSRVWLDVKINVNDGVKSGVGRNCSRRDPCKCDLLELRLRPSDF